MFVRQDGPNLEVLAPAKINLFLEVTGKRSDGFHELDMLMVPVALFDRLTLALSEDSDIHLSTSWALGLQSQPELPSPEENLVYHILSMFQDVVQQLHQDRPGICVKLVKRIPMAAGLGGASSDAAAALVAANQLLDNLLSFDQLFDIAVQTGSDVPFFLYRRPARCQGRGEIVMPVSSGQSLPVVLVKPEQGLSTPAVFSRLAEYGFDDTEGIAPMLAAFAAGDPSLVGARLHNR
ncbi:MAG: 4-(cytidine 5'-diphospho)-2-C-methyl-D-erythritol kinase, partial [Rhodopirellula sp.]|nr:4-(cytidine 5'-diphospho)-2-C-methyl-D-erythritol kinase [Rhodopirellula sp.]